MANAPTSEGTTMSGAEALKLITQECRDLLEVIEWGKDSTERNERVKSHLMVDASNYGISVGEWTGTSDEETSKIIDEVLAKPENNQ